MKGLVIVFLVALAALAYADVISIGDNFIGFEPPFVTAWVTAHTSGTVPVIVSRGQNLTMAWITWRTGGGEGHTSIRTVNAITGGGSRIVVLFCVYISPSDTSSSYGMLFGLWNGSYGVFIRVLNSGAVSAINTAGFWAGSSLTLTNWRNAWTLFNLTLAGNMLYVSTNRSSGVVTWTPSGFSAVSFAARAFVAVGAYQSTSTVTNIGTVFIRWIRVRVAATGSPSAAAASYVYALNVTAPPAYAVRNMFVSDFRVTITANAFINSTAPIVVNGSVYEMPVSVARWQRYVIAPPLSPVAVTFYINDFGQGFTHVRMTTLDGRLSGYRAVDVMSAAVVNVTPYQSYFVTLERVGETRAMGPVTIAQTSYTLTVFPRVLRITSATTVSAHYNSSVGALIIDVSCAAPPCTLIARKGMEVFTFTCTTPSCRVSWFTSDPFFEVVVNDSAGATARAYAGTSLSIPSANPFAALISLLIERTGLESLTGAGRGATFAAVFASIIVFIALSSAGVWEFGLLAFGVGLAVFPMLLGGSFLPVPIGLAVALAALSLILKKAREP